MKMNEVIKKKRKELNLTQEQIAGYLGVSTPAVNKWEKGSTYPDITLLPGLARLLQIDMNTLMSFNEDLTENEIKRIIIEIEKKIETENYNVGLQLALDYIRDFPTCEELIYAVALSLITYLATLTYTEREKYVDKIEALFLRICQSKNNEIKNEALTFLFMRCCERKEFEEAEKLIGYLPIDKKVHTASLCMEQENYNQATILFESRLFEDIIEVQNILHNMVKISIYENRIADAQTLAKILEKVTDLFDIMPCTAYTAQLECASYQKDEEKTVFFLSCLLKAMSKKWDIQSSVLYSHLDFASANIEEFNPQLLPAFVEEIQSDKGLKFLSSNKEFLELLEQYKNRGGGNID